MKQIVIPTLYIAIFLACSGARVWHWSSVNEIREFPDTVNYVAKASWPLWSSKSWFEKSEGLPAWLLKGRSFTVPLFYKLAGNVPRSIVNLQLILSIVCWALLAVVVARAIRVTVLKPIAFLVILLLSLCDSIIMWDSFLLSDSISLSLTVLFVAIWIWLFEGWNWWKALLLLVVAALWTFTRDTNAWVILMLAVLMVVSPLPSRKYLVVAAVFVGLFAVNEISQNYANRWVMPFVNVLGRRILPDPEYRTYFAKRGMPLTPDVMRLSGQLAWSQDRLFYRDPALHEFRQWVHTQGKRTYMRFLVAHPGHGLVEPFRHAQDLVAPNLNYFQTGGFSPILPEALGAAIFWEEWPRLLIWGPLILVLGLRMIIHQRQRNLLLLSVVLILLFYPHAAIAWHGDANGVGRHAFLASLHLRIGLWLLLLSSADMLLLGESLQVLKSRSAQL